MSSPQRPSPGNARRRATRAGLPLRPTAWRAPLPLRVVRTRRPPERAAPDDTPEAGPARDRSGGAAALLERLGVRNRLERAARFSPVS